MVHLNTMKLNSIWFAAQGSWRIYINNPWLLTLDLSGATLSMSTLPFFTSACRTEEVYKELRVLAGRLPHEVVSTFEINSEEGLLESRSPETTRASSISPNCQTSWRCKSKSNLFWEDAARRSSRWIGSCGQELRISTMKRRALCGPPGTTTVYKKTWPKKNT